jgi:hypothetical protein
MIRQTIGQMTLATRRLYCTRIGAISLSQDMSGRTAILAAVETEMWRFLRIDGDKGRYHTSEVSQ